MIKKKSKKFSDDYFNGLARDVLNNTFNLNIKDKKEYTGSDKPDLFKLDNSFGVEVTQVLSKEDGYCLNLFQRDFSKEKVVEILNKHKYQQYFKVSNDTISYSLPIDKTKKIIDSIKEKLELLNKTYTIYDSNGLFLFASNTFGSELKQIMCEYEKIKASYKCNFDVIYILTTTKLFRYVNNVLNEYDINLEKYRK